MVGVCLEGGCGRRSPRCLRCCVCVCGSVCGVCVGSLLVCWDVLGFGSKCVQFSNAAPGASDAGGA